MALLVPNEGEQELLSRMLSEPVVLRLYTNNLTPVEGSTHGDFTEATDSSYASSTIAATGWTISESGGTVTAAASQVDFTFGGTATVYGYFVTDTGDATCLWAEIFGSAASFGAGGGTVSITPQIELD